MAPREDPPRGGKARRNRQIALTGRINFIRIFPYFCDAAEFTARLRRSPHPLARGALLMKDLTARWLLLAGALFALTGSGLGARQEKPSPTSEYQYKKDYAEVEGIMKETDADQRAGKLLAFAKEHPQSRSEERRVGKEGRTRRKRHEAKR